MTKKTLADVAQLLEEEMGAEKMKDFFGKRYNLYPSDDELLAELIIKDRPLSVNRAYKTSRNRHGMYASKKLKNFKGRVARAASKARLHDPYGGPLGLVIDFYFSRKHRSKEKLRGLALPDVDNCLKPLKDALEDILYYDDTQIQWLRVKKFYSKENPRTCLKLYRVTKEEVDKIKDRGEYPGDAPETADADSDDGKKDYEIWLKR